MLYKLDYLQGLGYHSKMTVTAISIDEFRSNLAEFINKATYGNKRVVIKKYKRPAAVLLSVEEYEMLIDPTKRLSKMEWDQKVQKLDTIRAEIPVMDPDVIEREINRAVQEVRADKQNKRA